MSLASKMVVPTCHRRAPSAPSTYSVWLVAVVVGARPLLEAGVAVEACGVSHQLSRPIITSAGDSIGKGVVPGAMPVGLEVEVGAPARGPC